MNHQRKDMLEVISPLSWIKIEYRNHEKFMLGQQRFKHRKWCDIDRNAYNKQRN